MKADGVRENLGGLRPGEMFILDGQNFTGRSDLLREFTGLALNGFSGAPANINGSPMAFVGPELYNSISGLALTVEGEIQLHSRTPNDFSLVLKLFSALGISHLLQRNPFTLSGGEQAVLIIASGLALRPGRMAIDCVVEQLHSNFRLKLLEWIRGEIAFDTSLGFADNRLNEYSDIDHSRVVVVEEAEEKPRPLMSSTASDVFSPPQPCRLALNSVSFSYSGGPPVLIDISVELEPGSVYILEGRNGAGKTTLSKILAGVLKPTGGNVAVDGFENSVWKHPGRVVAYHFQNPDLQLFATSVREEIANSIPEGMANAKLGTEEILRVFGLLEEAETHPLDLPFVMRKRLAMAASLAMRRPWLILDEPTLGQDSQTSTELSNLIRYIASQGTGVIVITHSRNFRDLLDPISFHLHDGIIAMSKPQLR